MNPSPRRLTLPLASIALAAALAPAAGRADLRLLDAALEPPAPPTAAAGLAPPAPADLGVAGRPSRARPASSAAEGQPAPGSTPGSAPPPLDFDLLGPPPSPPGVNPSLALRRALLDWHQGAGMGLYTLTLAATVVGQLDYGDRFAGSRPPAGRYRTAHAVLAYGALVELAGTASLALLAPAPPRRGSADRMTLHKAAMSAAAAGMVAQGALGVWTRQREGYANQESLARAHLALGYAVLAALTAGAGAIVF